ncbi:MAG: segregation/condensation protein A, partial [Anaerolineae bacterium]
NPGEGNISNLLLAVQRALTVKPDQPDVNTVISRQEVTIGKQINMIRIRLGDLDELQFEDLLAGTRSRVEVIVTLLAVLELIKRRVIDVKQEDNFGNITLIKRENADLTEADWSKLENMTEIS